MNLIFNFGHVRKNGSYNYNSFHLRGSACKDIINIGRFSFWYSCYPAFGIGWGDSHFEISLFCFFITIQ